MLHAIQRLTFVLLGIAGSVAVTYGVAGLALDRPELLRLDEARASAIAADYSADDYGAIPSKPPLDPGIIDAAAADAAPPEATPRPRPTATATPTVTPEPIVILDRPTPVPTDTPEPEPTDTPEPEPTDTPEPEPTDTPPPPTETPEPTDTPTSLPTGVVCVTPKSGKTGGCKPTSTPTRTPTPTPAVELDARRGFFH